MQHESPIVAWHHHARDAERAPVFPDGCRDVLIVRRAGQPPQVVLTALDFRPRIVALPAGVRITGYRLRPGAVVSARDLAAVGAQADRADRVEAILHGACAARGDLDDAIAALAVPGTTAEAAARALGVSVRTLQRRFVARALPPPEFWRLLARARRAAGQLGCGAPLAQIADACGFSDQAHMTRELVRWFGQSPGHLRRQAPTLELLHQPALGNWTGEQISTR